VERAAEPGQRGEQAAAVGGASDALDFLDAMYEQLEQNAPRFARSLHEQQQEFEATGGSAEDFARTIQTVFKRAIDTFIASGGDAESTMEEMRKAADEAGISLKSGLGDRWIPARYTARKSGRGFGYLVASTLLARRR